MFKCINPIILDGISFEQWEIFFLKDQDSENIILYGNKTSKYSVDYKYATFSKNELDYNYIWKYFDKIG